MSGRAILIFGTEVAHGGPPNHYFWLYLIEEKRVLPTPFRGKGDADDWAAKNNVLVVDDWLGDEITLEDVVAANAESGNYVICITVYRGGQPAPNNQQPPHRFWIFREDGACIATRATLGEALGWIKGPPYKPPQDNEKPPAVPTWEP